MAVDDMPCSNDGGAIGAGPICEGCCGIFPNPIGLLFDIGRLDDTGELLIICGAGGAVGGLIGGDLLSPVSRRLFEILVSPSSDRSRFKLEELTDNEGSEDGAFGDALSDCLRAMSFANKVGRSA